MSFTHLRVEPARSGHGSKQGNEIQMRDGTRGIVLTVAIVATVIAIAAGGLVGCPHYRVWQQGMEGRARLGRAEQERQILIAQASAEREAAKLRSDAIQIIGQAAKDFPEYRLQEFMAAFAEALQSDSIDKIIFVPTEANIPVVEAGRTVRGR